jgi:hypothetical protein
MISTGECSSFVHQSSLAILSVESSSISAGGGSKGNDEFGLTKYLFHTSKGSLTFRKNYDIRPTALLPPPKEGLLRIFISS